MRLHCFHGFLGSPSDFDFLRESFDIVAYDMKELCSKDKARAFSSLDIPAEDVLVGYSFGARFALELMAAKDSSKLVMLAGHAGLEDKERAARLKVEKNFMNKVEELEFDDFIRWWNGLELFRHDSNIDPAPWSKGQMKRMFAAYGLSQQSFCLDFVRENKDRITWVSGVKDIKYYNYTKENIEPLGVKCVYLNSGHRILARPAEVKRIIQDALEDS